MLHSVLAVEGAAAEEAEAEEAEAEEEVVVVTALQSHFRRRHYTRQAQRPPLPQAVSDDPVLSNSCCFLPIYIYVCAIIA
ncbi:MAG: hypothetical protein MRY64_09005, partial [Hyphomonadaceae bacterium]|nr:hypothetical protein [Hyphomonadaceae bacterium]